MKEFGKLDLTPVKTLEFGLKVIVNGETVRHEFRAQPRVSANDMINVAKAERDPAGSMIALRNIIRRCLLDDDGVPARWRPDALSERPEPVTVEWPAVSAGDLELPGTHNGIGQLPADAEPEDWFEGPDGMFYRMTDAEALEKFDERAAGSSRRRWDYLIDRDDESIIQMDDLHSIAAWLVKEAGNGRPTGRPSR